MYSYDVNGDGLNDVITSLAAHGYGLAWFEQYREGGQAKFRDHTFMNKEEDENRYGERSDPLPGPQRVTVRRTVCRMDGPGSHFVLRPPHIRI